MKVQGGDVIFNLHLLLLEEAMTKILGWTLGGLHGISGGRGLEPHHHTHRSVTNFGGFKTFGI